MSRQGADAFPSAMTRLRHLLLRHRVTLLLPNPQRRYPLACREDPERLGVRLIGGPLGGAMCPLFQTSANRSSEPAAASAWGVVDAMDAVDR